MRADCWYSGLKETGGDFDLSLWLLIGTLIFGVNLQQGNRPAVAGEKQKPDSAVPQ